MTIEIVSGDSAADEGNSSSVLNSPGGDAISADGRFVAFSSNATDLVAGDLNSRQDIFVKDLQTGTITLVSTDSSGAQSNDFSFGPSISADGRFIVFESAASNLVSGDTNARRDVFVKDLQTGAITRVSTDAAGAQANHQSFGTSISADGRFVGFGSDATNLVAGDTNASHDIFVKDLQTGAITRVSTDASGAQANGSSSSPSFSADGRFVAFISSASNLVTGDTNGAQDIFVKDLQTGAVTLVSTAGTPANGFSTAPSISNDGRYVTFQSLASNLVAADSNSTYDVFLKDLQTGTLTRVSTDAAGAQANAASELPSFSADGRFVGFESDASNLVAGDTNGFRDVFIKDLQTGAISRVSTDSAGGQGNDGSTTAAISGDGQFVAFYSFASNLVVGDGNAASDVFRASNPLAAPPTNEETVNTTTAGQQRGPSVAALFDPTTGLPDGRFVITWQSQEGTTTSHNIFGRMYDADGVAIGPEFSINTTTSGDERSPVVAALPDGGFVVTWDSIRGPGQGVDIFARVFDANGDPVVVGVSSNDFQVSTTGTALVPFSDQVGPNIATLADGRFVVTWSSRMSSGGVDIYGRMYNADGTPAVVSGSISDFPISTLTANDQSQSSLTALAGGGFFVVWASFESSTSSYDIRAREYNADGTPADAESVLSATAHNQGAPRITTLADGGFVMTWHRTDPLTSDLDVVGQVFNADATAAGGDFVVHTTTAGSQFQPDIAALPDGRFAVVWASNEGPSSFDIRGRIFNADGTAAGGDFVINTMTANDQLGPKIAALPDGRLVVTWFHVDGAYTDADSTTNQDIRVRILEAVPEVPIGVGDIGSAGENETKLFDVLANDASIIIDQIDSYAIDSGNTMVDSITPAALAGAFGVFTLTDPTNSFGRDLLRFTPGTLFDPLAAGDTAEITVNYTKQDGLGLGVPATFTLTVVGVNDLPVASPDTSSAGENGIVSFDVLANDTDVDFGDTLTLASFGTVTVTSDNGAVNDIDASAAFSIVGNELHFSPGTLFDALGALETATVTVEYTMKDGLGEPRSSTLTLTVHGTNDTVTAPVDADTATGDSVAENATNGTAVGITASAADVDATGNAVTYSLTDDAGGRFAIDAASGIVSVSNATLLDFETATLHTIIVEAASTDGSFATAIFTVAVTDVAEITNGNSGGTVAGTGGNDVIDAAGGNDVVSAGSGDDTVLAGTGNDVVNAGSGNDTVIGGSGSDIVAGGNGSDAFVATIGDANDFYSGGAGTDTLDMSAMTAPVTINLGGFASSAQTGIDLVSSIENAIAGSGNDNITGSSAANVLEGRAGNDTINAGNGADTVIGGLGDDIMNGGTGSDTFVFAPGFGNDRIQGFDANTAGGQDRLDVTVFGISAADFAMRVAIADVGADTLITVDGLDTVRLLAIGNATTVTDADFLLA
jgi:Ca2+-binding RTX toxin-like protein